MPVDILIYAIVAAGLVFWLRSVLGTRNGSERQRSNPFTSIPGQADGKPAMAGGTPMPASGIAEALVLPPHGKVSMGGAVVETGLMSISRADRAFHLGRFTEGAQDAFVMIVEAFAAGDRTLLKELLTPDLYAAFDQAITEREAEGRTVNTEIHAIRKIEIAEAMLKGQDVFITLRFVADETSVE
ncbi:MAG TPA: Tim44/TimA family putative adaptor protein, partial [Micavibrio sp.]